MAKALITTVPFSKMDRRPLVLLEEAGIDYLINPLNKKLTESELAEMVTDFDVIIAGTEAITEQVMNQATALGLISRVGIGLDGVDLGAAEKRGIKVSYTPDAPSTAVAELTLGLMLSLLRATHLSNMQLHAGLWTRHFGRRLAESTVGIIGVGRIGKGVIRHLSGFNPKRILLNDLVKADDLDESIPIEWTDKETIYRDADVITLHLPLSKETSNLVRKEELMMMKPDAIVINTARGGIINETDLYNVMLSGHLAGAAIDVFEQEPYNGNLQKIDRCLLTAHMGSMSVDCRTRMEIEATEAAISFLQGKPLKNEVPDSEYVLQR